MAADSAEGVFCSPLGDAVPGIRDVLDTDIVTPVLSSWTFCPGPAGRCFIVENKLARERRGPAAHAHHGREGVATLGCTMH